MSDQGPTPGSGLGIIPWPEEEPVEDGLEPSGEETPTEAPPEAPAETPSPEPEAPAVETETAPPAEAEEGVEEEQPPVRYAGKFGSVEALEKGYQEAETWGTRNSQALAEERRAREALQAQVEQTNQLLESLAPVILQQMAGDNPEIIEQLERQQQVRALVEQQTAPVLQQQQQAREAEAEQIKLLQSIVTFRQAHPDVTPNSEADQQVAQVVDALDLDPVYPESLDLAYEASRDPHLLAVLQANPHFIESEPGLAEARLMARWREQQVQAPTQGAPTASQAAPAPAQPSSGQARRTAAYVETGGQQAPTSGAPGGAKDEIDEMIAVYNENKSSPLFGGPVR